MKVAPSLLACDFGNLNQEIESITSAGADWLHLDIMDGIFVPNISIGLPILEACKKVSKIPLDVHLMIAQPEKYIDEFIKAGATFLTLHVESTNQVRSCLNRIRSLGKRAGISLRPGTPIQSLEPFLDDVDLVLVMTVEPGFGGQSFLSDQVRKIDWLYEQREIRQLPFLIEVDGGINNETAQLCKKADALVSGTYLFKASDRSAAIRSLRF
jgi:ribulose-phosphate 3-epimerase